MGLGDVVLRDTMHELPLVMAQITDIMAARESALTLHHDDGTAERVVYAQSADGLSDAVLMQLRGEHARWASVGGNDGPRWIVHTEGSQQSDVLLMFVSKAETYSRLLISVFFDRLTPELKQQADMIYERRAPFAIGYFRLWQLNRSRERAIGSLRDALNLSGLGVILLDCRGQIVFANHVANSLLNDGDGLRRANGGVRTHSLSDSVRLQVAIEHITTSDIAEADRDRGHRAPLLSVRRAGRPALMLSVLPTQTVPEEPSDIGAVIYIMDPSREVKEQLQPVCEVYGLSRVETQLACHLVHGRSLSNAADIMRVKEMTARSYLKQIFLKTDTHRQSELMHLMLSSLVHTNPVITSQAF